MDPGDPVRTHAVVLGVAVVSRKVDFDASQHDQVGADGSDHTGVRETAEEEDCSNQWRKYDTDDPSGEELSLRGSQGRGVRCARKFRTGEIFNSRG